MSSFPSLQSGALKTATAPASQGDGKQTGLLTGLGLTAWLEFYTFDAVNLVLPDMAGSFGVSQDEASWLLITFSTSLFLGVAVSIWLARHIGYLRYILGSIAVFAVASLGCAFATDFGAMLLWRAVSGFAGAGLAMWWRGSVYLLIPRPRRSVSMMRISMMIYLSTALGLLVSGYVTDQYTWRLLFVPNIVVAVVAIWLLTRHFPKVVRPTDIRSRGIDVPGLLLLSVVLVCAQVMMSRGQAKDWFGSSEIRGLAWAGLSALVLFVGWQLHHRNDRRLHRLELLRHRDVTASVVLGVLAGIIVSGSTYALPEFLRTVYSPHLDATHTGRVLCVYALTAAAIRPLVTRSVGKFGPRKVLAFAFVLLTISMSLMSHLITTTTPYEYFALPLILYAFCLSPVLSALASGTVARLPQEVQLDAVAVYMTFRQFGMSLGVTLVTVVLAWREQLHSSRLFDFLYATSLQVDEWMTSATAMLIQRGVSETQARSMAQALLAETAIRQARTLAYADAFMFMAAVGLLALCFVPLMAPAQVTKKALHQTTNG
ncbi:MULTISPECIES: MFS transporter [Pandoraea]|uniref:MFS transporter n=1 Tax=Pandoraea TaxID=93217 RepID=UPI001F5E2573|nr:MULTISPECIES: MFS transporter [Pandoraea]MCI3206470.1 MFS transporter [Pandoraea sp. LA3]MDN4584498.1 MFS transporter [Pandoraea capi]